MELEQYKQQGLDLFKRFEIAVPQKKTEQVLQVGNEIGYKYIYSTSDSKYLVCCAYNASGLIHIREFPSGKCILEHRFDHFLNEMSELNADNMAIVKLEGNNNLLVKFPECDILHAFNGYMSNLKLCPDKKSFLFTIENEYYIYKSTNNIIHIDGNGHKIKEVYISGNNLYALIRYEFNIELFSLSQGKILYKIHDNYKIHDASISSDNRNFIYSARDASKDGYMKTIELETGKLVNQFYAILYNPEFEVFNNGWVFNAGKLIIYYPDKNLIKEINEGYVSKTILETTQKKYLLLIDSYRDKNYVDWNKFVVYDIDNVYDSVGIPAPIKRVDYQTRFSDIYVSPDCHLVAVCYPSKAIEFYSVGDFKTLSKIEIETNNAAISMAFSNCSRYFILSYRNQLMIYNTLDFSLTNKPITALNYYHYNKNYGLISLTNSLNAIQIRRYIDGSILLDIPGESILSSVLSLLNQKVWIEQYNGTNYYPVIIDLQNGEKKKYDVEVYHLNQIDEQYIISNLGIIHTPTGELKLNAQLNINFENSYFYSFPKYSVKVNKYAISIFENSTAILVKIITPSGSDKFGYTLTVCGDSIIYEIEYGRKVFVEKITNSDAQIMLTDLSVRKIENIDEEHFFLTTYRVNPDITDIYIYNINQLPSSTKELALEGNLYISVCDAQSQRLALSDSKICWYIDLKNPDNIFSIKEESNLGPMLFDNVLVKVSANNKLQYYNTLANNIFKCGELLATLYTLPDGFLWTIPPDTASPSGWFWTNKPEYIEVMQYVDKKCDYELLSHSSPEYIKYIELHNRQDLVMARINNPDEYNNTLANLLGKMQMQQLQQFKHTLILGS